MDLIRRKVQVPDVSVVRDENLNEAVRGSTVARGDEGAKVAGIAAIAGPHQLKPRGEAVSGWICVGVKTNPQLDGQVSSSLNVNGVIVADHNRQFFISPGNRYVLTAQLRKSMISGHEQIVAGNVVVLPEWRPMGVHCQSQSVPLLLYDRQKILPSLNRTKVNGLLVHLEHSAREFGMSPVLPIAYAIPVEKGDFPHRGPAVAESGIWLIYRHRGSILKRNPV